MALTDLTRISTSGIATGSTIDAPILRKDVSFRGSQVGVTSALFDSSEDKLNFKDNVKLELGNDPSDLFLVHNGTYSQIAGIGNFFIQSNSLYLKDYTNGHNYLKAIRDGAVDLYHDNTIRISTTNHGAVVTGILTATSFSGPLIGSPINNPSGISTFYDLRVSNNLTVEGTTTTLDTNLIGVDRVEVGANSNSVVGVAITQSGTADIINLFDGGTNVLTVTDTGDVGIGTDNPQEKIHIHHTGTSCVLVSGTTAPQIRFNPSSADSSDNDRSALGQATANSQFVNSAVSGDTVLRGTSSGNIKFGHGTTEVLRITNSGNLEIINNNDYLKIGNGGPLQMVHTGGEAFIANATGHLTHRCDVHKWENEAGTAEYLRITSDGNITFGSQTGSAVAVTSSAIKNLNLGSDYWNGTKGDYRAIREHIFYINPNDLYGFGISLNMLEIQSQQDIGFFAGTSGSGTGRREERLRITSGGNVNIGTGELTQTARMLNVYGGAARVTQTVSGNTIEAFGHTTSGQSYGLLVNAGSTSADYAAEFRNKDATSLLRIRGDGKVGINTTIPSALLNINTPASGTTDGVVISRDLYGMVGKLTNSGGGLQVISNKSLILKSDPSSQFTAAGSFIAFEIDGTEKVRIRNDGFVGIGTDNPSAKTHIYDSTSTSSITEQFRISGGNRTAATFETGFRFFTQSPSANGNRHVRFTSNGNTGLIVQPYETSSGNAAVDRNILLCPDGGKVGIGTDNPSGKLDISAAASTDMLMFKNGATNFARLGYNSASGTAIFDIRSEGHTRFLTGGNYERLRIISDGHIVTQGLTSPSFFYSSTKVLEVSGNGNVGNTGVLNISGNINSQATVGAIRFNNRENTATSSGSSANSINIASIDVFADTSDSNAGDDCGGFMRFITKADGGGNAERLRIASNGKIGINNNNPQWPLHITNTSSTFNSAALIKGDNSTSGQAAYATFTNTTDGGSAYFGLDGNGLFAIDPGAALIGTSGTEPIIFATNGINERFRIQASTTDTIVVQQAGGADIFTVSSDTATTRQQNSLTYVNYGLAIGKSRSQNATAYGTNGVYTPYYHGEGEKVFGIDSSWSQPELRRFFGNDTVEWYAEEDAPGGYCIKVTGACNVGSNYGSGFPYLPIDDDDQFFQEMWIRVDSGVSNLHYAGSIQLDKDFANPTGVPGSFGYELMVGHTTNSTTWERRTATLGPNHGSSYGDFRSGYTGGKRKYVTPQALLNYQNNSGARVCYISGWAWYRRRSRGNTHFASISKGSGSFQIKHPLEAKKDTHYLRHSFIEGPKCDNIYRGKATLSSGTATVNLDTEGTMTEGTFVALNDNVQCYTTNETGWGAVKGSVSGNILTITAQDNTSTDTISWMVVGERKDDEIKASDLTDTSGKLLVEPRVDQQYVGLSTTPMVAPGMES